MRFYYRAWTTSATSGDYSWFIKNWHLEVETPEKKVLRRLNDLIDDLLHGSPSEPSQRTGGRSMSEFLERTAVLCAELQKDRDSILKTINALPTTTKKYDEAIERFRGIVVSAALDLVQGADEVIARAQHIDDGSLKECLKRILAPVQVYDEDGDYIGTFNGFLGREKDQFFSDRSALRRKVTRVYELAEGEVRIAMANTTVEESPCAWSMIKIARGQACELIVNFVDKWGIDREDVDPEAVDELIRIGVWKDE